MGMWDLDEKIGQAFPWTKPYLWLIPFVTFGLAILLILTALVELFSWWVELYYRLVPSVLSNVSVTLCQSDDLPKIVEIAKARIGTTMDLAKTQEIYNHNRRSIWKVRDNLTNEIIGYYCVLPLTARGEQKVKERDLLIGDMDKSCFAKTFRKGAPIYIGGVAGLTRKAGAAALEQLKALVIRLEATTAYAKPATTEGVRLVKRHGFVAVSDYDQVDIGVYVCRIRSF